jgi:VanZ family protein
VIGLLRLLFWSAVVCAFAMAVLPHPPLVPEALSDKVQHMLAFACLALLGSLAYPRLAVIRLVLALIAFGALIELVQLVPALHRDADSRDWLVDTAAVVATVVAILGCRRVRARQGRAARRSPGTQSRARDL